MSLYSLSSTLTWLSNSDSKTTSHGLHSRRPSPSTTRLMSANKSGAAATTTTHSHGPAGDATADLTLARAESMSTTDYEIGLGPAAAAGASSTSLTSSELQRSVSLTEVFYEFATSPNPINVDADVHGGGASDRSKATAEAKDASTKHHRGGTATYHDNSSSTGTTASSIRLLVESFSEQRTPAQPIQQPSPTEQHRMEMTTAATMMTAPSTAPPSQPIATAVRHGSFSAPLCSPLGLLESDGKGNYYYFQPLLASVGQGGAASSFPSLPERPNDVPEQRQPEEERLDELPRVWGRHSPAPPPTRPATFPVVRLHLLSGTNHHSKTDAVHTQPQPLLPPQSNAEYMTPLARIHGRQKRKAVPPRPAPVADDPTSSQSSSMRTVDVTAPQARAERCTEPEIQVVPTVVALRRLLRRLRPIALSRGAAPRSLKAPASKHAPSTLRSGQVMATRVSTLHSSILQSSSRVQHSLSRNSFSDPSMHSAVQAGERGPRSPLSSSRCDAHCVGRRLFLKRTKTSSMVCSTRTVHPHAQHAVYEARLCAAPHAGASPLSATAIARLESNSDGVHSTEGGGGEQEEPAALSLVDSLTMRNTNGQPSLHESVATVDTIVEANPRTPATARRAIPLAPSAPPRQSSSAACRTRRPSLPADAALTPTAADAREEIAPKAARQESEMATKDEEGYDTRANLRELTRDIGREYDLMAASFAETLSASPASPSQERHRANTEEASSSVVPNNACIYVHPRPPPSSQRFASVSRPVAADAVMVQNNDDAADAAASSVTPFHISLGATSPRADQPNLKRYPSHITPVSLPTAIKAAAPAFTDTAPTPSKKFSKKSKLGLAGALAGPGTAVIAPRVCTAPKPKQKSPIAPPATAAIQPAAVLLPSCDAPSQRGVGVVDSIPMLRQRMSSREQQQQQQRRENHANKVHQSRPTPQTVRESIPTKQMATTTVGDPPTPPPPHYPQGVSVVSDDASVLQTSPNDSSYDPSQASLEWKDRPVPILPRSLIARNTHQSGYSEHVSSSVLTVHHCHHR
ncbi:hypothetical protein ABB37_08582 [Leptomonas pyrrhocoris]|uniref:Uncharacterized protein n=1 Tax=Leptomonas pyrrhocoris TaxID=157538 RepID=A0A0N0DS94_LEPPY|nr:hypothetical protein ABB37_08582 [Leptomonas pyrrhocoris]KPA75281.1 hypothetical protein ABB37_08582 [Leptomonas pyrrhocoris]|eukprot:XP_015653720.1 hypothetical protein ABB37_08582 [Leptomonas pyrrhocoris]